MSKTCSVVQYTLPYYEFGSALQVARTARVFEEADKYIKARKSPTAEVWRTALGVTEAATYVPHDDYRRPHMWTMPWSTVDSETGNIVRNYRDENTDMVMYRIFVDEQSATEWAEFCSTMGCYDVRIITEADRGVVPGVPSTLADFPTDEQIAPFLWNE